MAYATLDDLKKEISSEELIQLTDDEGLGQISTEVVTEILDKASAEIDGYLAVRYRLPLEETPLLLERICVDLAIYYLKLRRGVLDEDTKDRRDNARRLLESISRGRISLGVPEASERESSEVKVSTRERIFDSELWEGY